jgi:hypothetical protein
VENKKVDIMTYAFIGYAMYERGYTAARLDNIGEMEFLMLKDEFVKRLKLNGYKHNGM